MWLDVQCIVNVEVLVIPVSAAGTTEHPSKFIRSTKSRLVTSTLIIYKMLACMHDII